MAQPSMQDLWAICVFLGSQRLEHTPLEAHAGLVFGRQMRRGRRAPVLLGVQTRHTLRNDKSDGQ